MTTTPPPQTRRSRDERTLFNRYAGPDHPGPRRALPMPAHDFLVLAPHPLMLADHPPAPHPMLPRLPARADAIRA